VTCGGENLRKSGVDGRSIPRPNLREKRSSVFIDSANARSCVERNFLITGASLLRWFCR
jgi:hypothetical protein